MPDHDSQRKVVQAGGLQVIIAHVVDVSTSPLIRSEAVRALWCMLVENPGRGLHSSTFWLNLSRF
jgi:hypothetical protein